MKCYTQRCPYCGAENRNLLLEDSDGWMECSQCLRLTHFQGDWHFSAQATAKKAAHPRAATVVRVS